MGEPDQFGAGDFDPKELENKAIRGFAAAFEKAKPEDIITEGRQVAISMGTQLVKIIGEKPEAGLAALTFPASEFLRDPFDVQETMEQASNLVELRKDKPLSPEGARAFCIIGYLSSLLASATVMYTRPAMTEEIRNNIIRFSNATHAVMSDAAQNKKLGMHKGTVDHEVENSKGTLTRLIAGGRLN